jgi:uncharacterized protein
VEEHGREHTVVAHLLDTSVLVAPLVGEHPAVIRWFSQAPDLMWACCPVTQGGFIRVASGPAVSAYGLEPETARSILGNVLAQRSHHFWPDDIGILDALQISGIQLSGHRQVTDAYPRRVCMHHEARWPHWTGRFLDSCRPGRRTETESK